MRGYRIEGPTAPLEGMPLVAVGRATSQVRLRSAPLDLTLQLVGSVLLSCPRVSQAAPGDMEPENDQAKGQ